MHNREGGKLQTAEGVSVLSRRPHGVIDNVAGEDCESRVGHKPLDGCVHTLLKTDRHVAVVVAVRPGGGIVVPGRVTSGVRPWTVISNASRGGGEPMGVLPAADGFGALRVRTRHVLVVDMNIRIVDYLDGRLSARHRPTCHWLRSWKCDGIIPNLGVAAETKKGDAKEVGRLGANGHLAQATSNDGPFQLDGSGANVIILSLRSYGERVARPYNV
jgi:hypothetical protein